MTHLVYPSFHTRCVPGLQIANFKDPRIELDVSFIIHFLDFSFMDYGKHWRDSRLRKGIPGTQSKQKKELEPIRSTSRRGARAAYHDEYPRDLGPLIL